MASSQQPPSRSPLRSIITFVAVFLLMFVIFGWFKAPVQTTEVQSGAAKRAMDAIKQQQTGQQAPKQ